MPDHRGQSQVVDAVQYKKWAALASTCLRENLRELRSDPDALAALSFAYFLLGHFEEAECCASRAYLEKKDLEWAYYLAAEATLCSGGDKARQRALEHIEQFSGTKTNATLVELARFLEDDAGKPPALVLAISQPAMI